MLSSLETATRIQRLDGEERRAWESKLADYRLERGHIEDEARDDWRLGEADRARAVAARKARAERAREALDRTLAAAQRVNLAGRELASPRQGELYLAYFPLGAATWVGFAIEATGTTARVLGDVPLPAAPEVIAPPPGAAPAPHGDDSTPHGAEPAPVDDALAQRLSDRLLAPFRPQIERARAVRFFVPRALRAVDLHALPLGGRLLIERVPVTYGLDVRGEGGASPAPLAAPPRTEAIVVADPSGGLPDARAEGDAVRSHLAANGLAAVLLTAQGDDGTTTGKGAPASAATGHPAQGDDGRAPLRATSERVRLRLEGGAAAIFHLAGHARFSGTDGWESAIPLADGGALTVGDVLALASVPRLVVLSGCETGRSDGLGLAHAFVAAGAEAAVGTTRVVPDTDAARVMALFYANLRTDLPAADAAALALQATARALLHPAQAPSGDRPPRVDWESFRVFVP